MSELDEQPWDLGGEFASQETEGSESRSEALAGPGVQVPTPEGGGDGVRTTGKQPCHQARPDVTGARHAEALGSAVIAPHPAVRCGRPHDLTADRHDRTGVRREP